MKVPFGWLKSYCDPGMTVEEVGDALAMHSIELARISRLGVPSTEGFVVGRVISAEKHPDADRLSVCEVDTGDGTRTIVCGAPNVAAGQTVGVALPGAVLPDGTKLEQATLRGVVSDGMILSEPEVELGDDTDGIMVLPNGASPGTPLAAVLPISESILELEPTSNRVDCLGIYGVARELHAVTGAELAAAPWGPDAEAAGERKAEDYASVMVEVPELCPRFTARVFTDVRIGPSPTWLKARLLGAGMRPINNVVDITNYGMLLTAQPLHAFDLDEVPGGELIIRTAREGETMTTLDGVERAFDTDTVLVCDREGPSGIAGIMGGEASEVSDETTRVLLEVATWNGVNILRTSRKLGLRTDASTRFEKQLHPELALWA
jgi:phenylalanyl-tRNA synthetase beta chain